MSKKITYSKLKADHFNCIHYGDSSWCKKRQSHIWENDPCPDYQSSLPSMQSQLTENLVDSQSDSATSSKEKRR